MNNKFVKLVTVFFVAMFTLSAMAINIPPTLAQSTAVSVVPSLLEFGPADCVGDKFTIDVVVSDVVNLYGIDVKFAWDTEYLLYISHTAKIPVEDFPDGIIHEPGMFVKNVVDSIAGTYWLSYASMYPAPVFDGTGIAFNMTFQIIKQPNQPDPDVILTLDLTSTDLPDNEGNPITHDRNDGTVILHAKIFSYPPEPLLKVMPKTVSGLPIGDQFESSVYLLGINKTSGEETNLSPFWDVAGFDIYMNFKRIETPYLLLEAVDVTVDPDGWFAAFWPGGIFEVVKTINNAEGWIHVVFLGMPGFNGTHVAPNGQGRLLSVTFESLYESDVFPPPLVDITLKNARSFVHRATLDADAGLINLTSPVGTDWTGINPYDFGTPFNLGDWIDEDGDGELSAGDTVKITDGGLWHHYEVNDIKGTLELEQQPFPALDDYVWATDSWTDYGAFTYSGLTGRTTEGCYGFDGQGHADWTGNFTLDYLFASVNSITANHQDGTSTVLTPGVDYKVHVGDQKVELLTPIDTHIINEYYVAGQNGTPAGYPSIKYVATSISSVYVKFPNGTERYAIGGFGCFESPPPCEWWFEPDYPNELEGWWALDFGYPSPEAWPVNSSYWINYTAGSYLTIDYNAEPDPRPYYVEFNGTYTEFLALGDPVRTDWDEVYPDILGSWTAYNWTDSDTSGDITVGDWLMMVGAPGERTYLVTGKSTDIIVDQIRTICDVDPSHPYYCRQPIVEVAGFPHPDYKYCPWHNSDSSIGLPHTVKNGMYTAFFKPPGAWIDLYTQYPDPYGGQGPHKPSDMITPQCELTLYAEVTYNFWPEQNKDVAFEIKDNHMKVWGIFYARTNDVGIATVSVRLPWPCDDSDYYRGEWHVYATVDVAGKRINDTLDFKYDYLVNIWKVTTDKDSYPHDVYMGITVEYGSYAMQEYNVTLTVMVVDETGVPFGYAYQRVTIGGAEYCTYKNGTQEFSIYIPKFARAGVAKIYVGALSDFPQNGGCALGPLYTPPPEVGIEAA